VAPLPFHFLCGRAGVKTSHVDDQRRRLGGGSVAVLVAGAARANSPDDAAVVPVVAAAAAAAAEGFIDAGRSDQGKARAVVVKPHFWRLLHSEVGFNYYFEHTAHVSYVIHFWNHTHVF